MKKISMIIFLFLYFISIPLHTQENQIHIQSIQPAEGSRIKSEQSITIQFDKPIKKCDLYVEQPNFKMIKTMKINHNQLTIFPPQGNWGMKGLTLVIVGSCAGDKKNNKAEIALSFIIH